MARPVLLTKEAAFFNLPTSGWPFPVGHFAYMGLSLRGQSKSGWESTSLNAPLLPVASSAAPVIMVLSALGCCQWLTSPPSLMQSLKGNWGFPGGSVVKNPPVNAGDTGLIPWIGMILWSKKGKPTPVFLPGKFHGQRSLMGCSP